jgi:hypothetical protein
VRQGRTDAWIAHQLEVSTSELREFRRRHELNADDEGDETDLRDEIEAEIEAATREEELAAAESDDEPDDAGSDADLDDDSEGDSDKGSDPSDRDTSSRKPRRRRRRGGRGRSGRPGASMQATFDHGEEGYGLWLDPAIADDPIYSEHWAGHRPVEVSVVPDRIVIRRSGDSNGNGNGGEDED